MNLKSVSFSFSMSSYDICARLVEFWICFTFHWGFKTGNGCLTLPGLMLAFATCGLARPQSVEKHNRLSQTAFSQILVVC